MSTCARPLCDRPTRNNHTLCRTCRARLRDHLDQLPSLYLELGRAATRQTHLGPDTVGRAHMLHPPVPFDTRAADHLARIRRTLYTWTRAWTPDRWTIAGACAWLAQRHPEDAALAAEVAALQARALILIDTPPEATKFETGPCPELVDDGEHCGGQVWAWVPTDPDLRPLQKCGDCGKTWTSDQWARLGVRMHARSAELAAAAAKARAMLGWEAS